MTVTSRRRSDPAKPPAESRLGELRRENETLRRRLEESEETIRALCSGEVDAVVVDGGEERVFTLQKADAPYRLLVQSMLQPAATLTLAGDILSCNARFAEVVGRSAAALRGEPLASLVRPGGANEVARLLGEAAIRPCRGELEIELPDGSHHAAYVELSPCEEGARGTCLLLADLTEQRRFEDLHRTQQALRRSEAQLAAQLADSQLLQSISAQLIEEEDVEALYERIVEAAQAIARSSFASMQRVLPDEPTTLELLASRGFSPAARRYWSRVERGSATPCGMALAAANRLAIQDVEDFPSLAGTKDLELFRELGIRAVQSTPLLGRTGRLVGMISTHWSAPHQASERELRLLDVLARQAADLIERRLVQEGLRARTEQFATLLERAPIGVFVVDADFRIGEVNPVALPAFGHVPGGVVGRDFAEVARRLWHADFAEELVRRFRHTLETGASHFEAERAELRRDRGSVEHFEWRVDRMTLPDGRYGVVCYFRDVAPQVAARRTIALSEERFRKLVSILTDVPWTCAADGQFDSAQPAWQAFTGQSEEELRGFGWVNAIHPDDRDRMNALWRSATANGERYHAQLRLWHAPSQRYREVEVRAAPLHGSSGAVREWVGTCTDVTDRREAERELQDADRRKDEFLALLAHELRNPLAPIRNAVQVLRHDGLAQPELRWTRDVIERQVSHLTRLIDDLLDVSRITRNKLDLRKQRLELAEVVQAAVETSRPIIDGFGHRLTIELPAESVRLHGDLVRLSQVFMNLLTNAAKYTEPGGRIRLHAALESGHVSVRVVDTGVGIPAEKLPHLFEMFFQVERSLERSQGGLGIGLSLVRRLVELHGGTVEAQSDGPGRGSEFVVRLPVVGGDDAPDPDASGHGDPRTEPHRVLVVDDNRDAAESLAALLRVMGHEAHTAHDGLAAVAAVERLRPEVVLLDLGMPRLNGFEACRRIRSEPWGRDIFLVAVTGWGQEEDRRRTSEAGFDRHLIKPVSAGDLERIFETIDGGAGAAAT